MAKQPVNQEPAEVVIFYARARGGGAAVAASVQALANAVERTTQPRITARVMKALPAGTSANANAPEKTLFDSIEDVEDQQPTEVAGDEIDAADAPAVDDRKPPRKPPVYQFVKDLNLRPQGKPSLKDFYTTKAPADQQEQLLAIVYYLTHTLELSGVGADHIYTAMKDVGARVPSDISQAARNTSKRKGWLDTSDSANLRATTSGENHLEHDMPQAKA